MRMLINLYKSLLSFTLVVNAKLNNFLYDITLRKIKDKDKKTIVAYFRTHNEYYLQIGCGLNILPDWLNSDIEPKNDKIIYLDASEKFVFDDNTFQFVFSEHLVEHLDFYSLINFLTENYRILKVGGFIRIATPNLSFLHNIYQNPQKDCNKQYVEWALNQFLTDIANSPFTDSHINHVYVINNFHKAWGHQMIFTFETLKFILETVGFKNVIQVSVGKSVHKELSDIEGHSRVIPKQFNEMETMVLEAEK